MAEAVRRRHSIRHLALDSKSINEYRYNRKDFEMPTWLKAAPQVREAQKLLQKFALQAIESMREVMTLHGLRYNSLCPSSMPVHYELHKISIKRLLEWKDQWDNKDPTLVDSLKIPKESLKFTLDPHNYHKFCVWYNDLVTNFMQGPYAIYNQSKSHVQFLAARLLGQYEYQEWHHWWDNTFRVDMWKWESCLGGLIIPTWEEIIDDLYLMILDRVDGAEELANSLCATCSPPVTPQTSKDNLEYFLLT